MQQQRPTTFKLTVATHTQLDIRQNTDSRITRCGNGEEEIWGFLILHASEEKLPAPVYQRWEAGSVLH